MKKLLFLIHDLGAGGAEKVLVNLVNHLNPQRYDITVLSLFGGGVNEQFLAPHIHYRAVFPRTFPGNSKVMKLLTPAMLHRLWIRDTYDVEIAYLEGPSARIISGCAAAPQIFNKNLRSSSMWSSTPVPHESTKLVAWIHVEQHGRKLFAASFRNLREAEACYNRFHRIVCVSQTVEQNFRSHLPLSVPTQVLYNTVESDVIEQKAAETVTEAEFLPSVCNLIAVGTLKQVKGFHRLLPMVRRLTEEGCPVHLYILGRGPEEEALRQQACALGVEDHFTLLGYHTNPYKFVARADLFLCASFAEGFSTAATEALIVGTPVCTTEVSGMKEMLGEHNEYGVITANEDEALYQGIRSLVRDPALLAHYRAQAAIRGRSFRTENTVQAVEQMLEELTR